jgi:hypothetical protein
MKSSLKSLLPALAVAALAVSAMSVSASAQVRGYARGYMPYQGSVNGPYWNPHYQDNGTGTVPDWNRDPHNDR